MGRKLTYDQKEQARRNKWKLYNDQDKKCYYYDDCGVDFEKDNVYPQAAHIIIDSVVNIRKYGYEILDHIYNFKITCPNCNSKAIITDPETQSGIDHIEAIKQDLEEHQETMQKVWERR